MKKLAIYLDGTFNTLNNNTNVWRLDTHLRLDNEFAFHALALDEHREDFDPTFWTKTVKAGEAGAAVRPIENVEQRWFVGCHANVGGGYSHDGIFPKLVSAICLHPIDRRPRRAVEANIDYRRQTFPWWLTDVPSVFRRFAVGVPFK